MTIERVTIERVLIKLSPIGGAARFPIKLSPIGGAARVPMELPAENVNSPDQATSSKSSSNKKKCQKKKESGIFEVDGDIVSFLSSSC